MFKQLTALFILVALVAQTFNRAAVVASYYANTAAYAKNCENKAKPQLHCNGKCQMMKKLKEEEKKEQQNNNQRKAFQEEVLSSKSFFITVAPIADISFTHVDNYQVLATLDMPSAIFHPPSI